MRAWTVLLALLLMTPVAMAQEGNETAEQNMDDGAMDDSGGDGNETGSDTGSDDSDPSSGNNTVVWIIVVVALIALVYAYGRLRKPPQQ